MIAEVYPLLRLPRGKKAFDYLVPEDQSPQRGSFVRIPYRQEKLWGIVKHVKNKPPRGITLKALIATHNDIGIREEELSFFEQLSQDLAQSVSSVLNAVLPTPPIRPGTKPRADLSWLPLTLPRSEAQHVLRIVQTLDTRGQAFIQTPDLRRASAIILGYLQKQPEQKALILAPTVRDVRLVRSHLTGYTPLVMTGEETDRERFETWQAFRSSSHGILLGTRTALMAIDSHITTIFLLRSGDKAHKQSDRNPRYDTREVVWQHRQAFNTNLFCLDVAPAPRTLARFTPAEQLNWGLYPQTHVVPISQERFASASTLLSHTSLEAIASTLRTGKSVLCVYNKKEQWIECQRCQSKSLLNAHCPSCGATNLKTFSCTNQDIAKELKRLFPDHRVAFVDKEHSSVEQADILVVTTFFSEALFDPFHASPYGLIVHLTTDAPLYQERVTAIEDILHDVWQWAWIGFGYRAPVVIETSSQDLITHVLEKPFAVAQDELHARDRFHLPPSYRWSRIVLKEQERRRAEAAMTTLGEEISRIPNSIIHPFTWNKHQHLVLECGVPVESMPALLCVFTTLPDRYIIDTNSLA